MYESGSSRPSTPLAVTDQFLADLRELPRHLERKCRELAAISPMRSSLTGGRRGRSRPRRSASLAISVSVTKPWHPGPCCAYGSAPSPH
jgi:hypothetical protein